ncbi:MAG: hypothetical protein ACK5IQ_08325 [Bacteroidales bacterium]
MYMYEVSSAPGVRPITFTRLWAKTGQYTHPYSYSHDANAKMFSPLIHDLDGDGTPEFIVGNTIVDYNGDTKATMDYAGITINFGYVGLPIVADLDKDKIPEVIVGTNVYKYHHGTLTLWKQCPNISAQEGSNMVADINQDGNVDLVFHTMYKANPAFIKVWTPLTDQDLGNVITFSYYYGQRSLPFVGDIDGRVHIVGGVEKKYPEICFNTGQRLYAYKYTGSAFTQKWSMSHSDHSGGTILTLFDFNNDGVMELVYRDETLIHIFDGSGNSAQSIYTQTCGSETASELPIVVDATSDGSANIVVTGNNTSKSSYGEVMVFEGATSKWASCPNVWNQQLYSSLYVNTDLTIPDSVESVNITYTRPDLSTVQFYNGGPMQAPYVSEDTYLPVDLSPDVYIENGSFEYLSATSVKITVTVKNVGLVLAAASTPYQYYKNAKTTANVIGSVKLGTDLYPGQSTTITRTFTGLNPMPSQFYFRVVDDGINFPASGAYSDCNLTNNTKSFGTLELTKVTNASSACIDGSSIFTIKLVNNTNQTNNPTTYNNLVLIDSLGTGWQFISATPVDGSLGTFNALTRKMEWTLSSLAPGDTATLMIVAKTTLAGAIRNTVWLDEIDGTTLGREIIEAYVIVSSIQAPAAAVITPTNPTLCGGGSVTLTASTTASDYQWYKNNIEITGATLQTYDATTTGEYRVTYFDGTCVSQMSDSVVVKVSPLSEGGHIIPATSYVSPGSNSTLLRVASYTGDIVRWESSLDEHFTSYTQINVTKDTLRVNNLTDTTYYRVVVRSGTCDSAYSDTAVIILSCEGIAKDYFATISDGKPITIYPLDSVDFSGTKDLIGIGVAEHGTAVHNTSTDSVVYTPDVGFVGVDSFKYYARINNLCIDSAWVYVTVACLPHKIPDLTIEVCVSTGSYNINLLSYMPYVGMNNVKVWTASGTLISNPESYSVNNLKDNNTTTLSYSYEKGGLCSGSAPGKIFINSITDDRLAIFKDKTISVCGAYLKDGGYKLSSILPYISNGGVWHASSATKVGTSVNPYPTYLSHSSVDGWVFDAQGFWDAVVVANGNIEPNKVSVTIPYSTGAGDHCAGASKTVKLTIEITKE